MVTTTSLADNATAVADDVADQASKFTQKVREKADAMVDRVRPPIDAVAAYARSEPTKAMLISAAAGAGLMALIALLARPSRSPASQFRDTAMATIRSAALDLAGQAQSAAQQTVASAKKQAGQQFDAAYKKAQKKARQTFESAQQAASAKASDTADAASTAVTDAWQSLRDQAAPMVDKIRPQIDAAVSYAKEDPARAALGAATVGAVLLGLFSLLGRSDD